MTVATSRVKRVHKSSRLARRLLALLAFVAFSAAAAACAAEASRQGEDLLREIYQENRERLATNSFGLPLFLDSFERDGKVQVDVYGVFDYPFGTVVDALQVPAHWCDIVTLHPNVKACTSQELADSWQLAFYLGRKSYQRPQESRQVLYQFRKAALRQGYLDIMLNADEGPFGTRDHRISFEALPLDAGSTFVHVGYAYRDSLPLRLATVVYLTTLGSGKIGFTVTGTDSSGKPVYIGGARGAIERNAVRYYFAIQAFMKTLPYAEATRFSKRIGAWYDLTDRYRPQLFELDKQDYLKLKRAERESSGYSSAEAIRRLREGVGAPPSLKGESDADPDSGR